MNLHVFYCLFIYICIAVGDSILKRMRGWDLIKQVYFCIRFSPLYELHQYICTRTMQLADIWLIHHGRLCTKVCIASILVAMQLTDIWLIHHSLLCTKVCIIYHLPQKIVRGSFVFASWLKVDQNCNFLSRHLTHYLQNGRATMNINKKENAIIQKS